MAHSRSRFYCPDCEGGGIDGCLLAPENEPPVRRITEGPFWAVMLPDGRIDQFERGEPMFWAMNNRYGAECYAHRVHGRVVRVRSVSYEVEDV